ncbi:hypothetical protein SAMN05421837_101563 [Amycolatopsis pretoriensis]|uniref:Uncharacterized protein n=1 Tax=Amycolatopsis pretoriensis TaxID=218821 RepID=A0A1H5Q421_9PSEU|nr:hypothetical protein SAMN05421837_101563 [Amycolatopsis pretoriensis]
MRGSRPKRVSNRSCRDAAGTPGGGPANTRGFSARPAKMSSKPWSAPSAGGLAGAPVLSVVRTPARATRLACPASSRRPGPALPLRRRPHRPGKRSRGVVAGGVAGCRDVLTGGPRTSWKWMRLPRGHGVHQRPHVRSARPGRRAGPRAGCARNFGGWGESGRRTSPAGLVPCPGSDTVDEPARGGLGETRPGPALRRTSTAGRCLQDVGAAPGVTPAANPSTTSAVPPARRALPRPDRGR